MPQFERVIQQLAAVLGLIGFVGLLAVAGLTTLDVATRWFNWPLRGVNDLISLALIVSIPACLPACFLMKQNISVTILGAWLGRRADSVLEALAGVMLLVFMVLIVWQFIPYSADAVGSGLKTWTLALPVGPWWWVATGILALATVVQFAVVLRDLAAIKQPAAPAAPDAGPDTKISLT